MAHLKMLLKLRVLMNFDIVHLITFLGALTASLATAYGS